MITINTETGFVLYLVFMLCALCSMGAAELWRGRVHDWHISEEQLGECPECNLTFVVRRSEKVARCPRCKNLCPVRRK